MPGMDREIVEGEKMDFVFFLPRTHVNAAKHRKELATARLAWLSSCSSTDNSHSSKQLKFERELKQTNRTHAAQGLILPVVPLNRQNCESPKPQGRGVGLFALPFKAL